MPLFNKRCCTKREDYDPVPTSEDQPLIIGLDEKAKRKRIRRRICHFIFAAVALILVGHGVFAYMYARSHVECKPYEGGTTKVELPIYYPGSSVILHHSVASNDVLVTRVEKDDNFVTVTLTEEPKEEADPEAEIRLCVLKGGKTTGLGIFAHKKDQSSLPVIKNVVVEVPNAIPPPGITVLPPPKRHHCISGFLKWVGVWDSKGANAAKLEAEAYN